MGCCSLMQLSLLSCVHLAKQIVRHELFSASRLEPAVRVVRAVRDLADTHAVVIAIEIDSNEPEVPAELRRNAEHFVQVPRPRNSLVGPAILDRKRLLVPRCIEVLALVLDVTVDVDLDELRRSVHAKNLVVLEVPAAEQYRLDNHLRLEGLVVRLAP